MPDKGFLNRGGAARLLLDWVGHTDYQRFAVVGNARTGSSFLRAGLRTSRRILMHSEIFAGHNREVGKGFERILSRAFRPERRRIEAVGFKVFYYHLSEAEWNDFLALDDLKIIHLTRANRLRTVVSLFIARKTNAWHSIAGRQADPAGEDKRVALDPDNVLERLHRIAADETRIRESIPAERRLEVVYEDLLQHPHETIARAGAFLGVDDVDVDKTRIRKQNPEPLHQLILNYEEVQRALSNTPFATYLPG